MSKLGNCVSASTPRSGGETGKAGRDRVSNALGARIEAPKGVGCGEGVSLSPLGEGSGEGKFLDF